MARLDNSILIYPCTICHVLCIARPILILVYHNNTPQTSRHQDIKSIPKAPPPPDSCSSTFQRRREIRNIIIHNTRQKQKGKQKKLKKENVGYVCDSQLPKPQPPTHHKINLTSMHLPLPLFTKKDGKNSHPPCFG